MDAFKQKLRKSIRNKKTLNQILAFKIKTNEIKT